MKKVRYTSAAIKTLRRIPANISQRIREKISAYAEDPASQANNVKALKGRRGVRLRVGDWRVIMDEEGNVLSILEVGPRGGVYD